MSQMIDGARDTHDSLDPLAGEAPVSRGNGAAGRRRAASAEGDPFFADAPERAAAEPADKARRRGEKRRREATAGKAAAQSNGGGYVWWAVLASLVWVGAVIGFSAGLMRMPLHPVGGFVSQIANLDPRSQFMIFAVAIAPIGLILQTALTARRSQRLISETERLTQRIDSLHLATTGHGAVAASADLRQEAEAAARAFNSLEAGFEAAEERAQVARDRLEAERAALSKLVNEIDGEVVRITESLGALSGTAADGRSTASQFAEMVAAALSNGRGGDIVAPAPRGAAYESSLGAQVAAVAAQAPPRESGAPVSAGDRVRQMAEAAKKSLSGGVDESDERFQSEERFNSGDRFATDTRGATAHDDDSDFDDDYDEDYDEDVELDEEAGYEDERSRPSLHDDLHADAGPAQEGAEAGAALDWGKLIRAANFPDSEDDRETLDALYAVLSDPEAAALLQSAEDALSSLADLGLFMEDMQPHHAPVEIWRAFIVDNAQDGVMDLGGIRDPHALEDVSSALREKPDFDRTAKRFMERYETVLSRIFGEAPSPRMAVELADTRSGRAYMLIGRAFGRFG